LCLNERRLIGQLAPNPALASHRTVLVVCAVAVSYRAVVIREAVRMGSIFSIFSGINCSKSAPTDASGRGVCGQKVTQPANKVLLAAAQRQPGHLQERLELRHLPPPPPHTCRPRNYVAG
jgi:hypothetical protein